MFEPIPVSLATLLRVSATRHGTEEHEKGVGKRRGEGKGGEEGKIGGSFIVRLIRQKRIDC